MAYEKTEATRYSNSSEEVERFQQAMIIMWKAMARLYHPQWTRTNGVEGGEIFLAWCEELQRHGSAGVLRGMEAVRQAGNAYPPPLAKFIALCSPDHEGSTGSADLNMSEKIRGGKLKPTPNGVPLCWTAGSYTYKQLRESPCIEDQLLADKMQGGEWSHEGEV